MSGLERAVVLINSLFAFASFIANAATSRAAPPPWKMIRGLVAALALMYSGSYLWLFIHPDRILDWSSNMRGVSVFSWPIVWILPAVVTLKLARLTNRMNAVTERIDRHLGDRLESALNPDKRGEHDQ